MTKRFLALCLVLLPFAVQAEGLLSDVASRIKALSSYEVSFTVSAGDYRASGRYAVSGSAYFLIMGDAEVYCDGTTRYEINKAVREITIDAVDPAERNILNNPATALSFLDEEYDARTVESTERMTTLQLHRRKGADDGMSVDVTVDNISHLPVQFVYYAGSDSVKVALSDIRSSSSPLPEFDAAAYPDFEVIDFR